MTEKLSIKGQELNKTPEAQEIAQKEFLFELSKGSIYRAEEIKQKFNFTDEFLNSQQVQELLKEKFLHRFLQVGSFAIDDAIKIKNIFNLKLEIVQEQVQNRFLELLSKGDSIIDAMRIKNGFNLEDEFIQNGFTELLSKGVIKEIVKFKDELNIKEEFVQKGFIDCLSRGLLFRAAEIKDKFNLKDEFVQESAQNKFLDDLSSASINSAVEVIDRFNLNDEFVQKSVENQFLHDIYGSIGSALEIKNNFKLTDEFLNSKDVQELLQKEFLENLSMRLIDNLVETKRTLLLKEEFINSPIVQEKIQEIFLKSILNPNTHYEDDITKINENFNLNPQKIFIELVAKFQQEFDLIKNKFPKLYTALEKSIDSQINIMEIIRNGKLQKLEKSIIKNPFLEKAVENNPRYGSKLVLKYREFDKTSKQNIKILFDCKEEILNANKEIDPNSAEFRKLIQDKLQTYGRNSEIVSEMKKRGVNVESFLNYEDELHFTLGEQEDVNFSDKIKTPITRIKETLNKYQEVLNNALGEYKRELQSFKTDNPEKQNLAKQILDLDNKIKNETDERKVTGMTRGLESLKLKLSSLKQVDAWTKVSSDLFRLKSMIDNIFKYHDLCVSIESKLPEIEDRKDLIREKDKLAKNINQMKLNFKEFESFFGEYENKLKDLINPSLGEYRTLSLLQEIKENLGEELNHYDSDKNDINQIFFSENDENNSKLDGTDMKIYVSSRNPDLDLYLGNYCPCCICIDSEYHGEESPISDYVTDLGMQNIVVYDEKKEIPILTCWTFVGENSWDGEPVLVIDNIEANTEYTNNYPEQLKEKIAEYINLYAKSLNIKNIIQGPDNNDLIVFNTGEISRKFGGLYNREGGYYLESEREENFDAEEGYYDEEDDFENE